MEMLPERDFTMRTVEARSRASSQRVKCNFLERAKAKIIEFDIVFSNIRSHRTYRLFPIHSLCANK